MPSRCPHICVCGRTVASGARCVCQAARKAEQDRGRPSAHERGYDSKWRRARDAFLDRFPTCAYCGAMASIVDHIIPHRGDRKLFWRVSNWQPLCAPCHNSRKQREEKAA